MTTLINKETVEIRTYDLDNGDSIPDLAYFSVSETPQIINRLSNEMGNSL